MQQTALIVSKHRLCINKKYNFTVVKAVNWISIFVIIYCPDLRTQEKASQVEHVKATKYEIGKTKEQND